MILLQRDFASDDFSLVSNPTLPRIRSLLIPGRTNKQDKLILADRAFHEGGQLVARRRVPLIENDIDSICPEPRGQVANPDAVLVAVPGI
jgi:hypothetical protein